MNDHEAIAKGNRAAAELTETEEAFSAVRDIFVAKLIETSPERVEKIMRLHSAVQTLDSVREILMQTVQHGKHAEYAQAARDATAASGITRA